MTSPLIETAILIFKCTFCKLRIIGKKLAKEYACKSPSSNSVNNFSNDARLKKYDGMIDYSTANF